MKESGCFEDNIKTDFKTVGLEGWAGLICLKT
jgi:hypothetical protein